MAFYKEARIRGTGDPETDSILLILQILMTIQNDTDHKRKLVVLDYIKGRLGTMNGWQSFVTTASMNEELEMYRREEARKKRKALTAGGPSS